jgi:hypothetical protein
VGTEHDAGREYITNFEVKTSTWLASVHVHPGLDRQIAQGMRANGWERDKGANTKDARGYRVRRYWRPA